MTSLLGSRYPKITPPCQAQSEGNLNGSRPSTVTRILVGLPSRFQFPSDRLNCLPVTVPEGGLKVAHPSCSIVSSYSSVIFLLNQQEQKSSDSRDESALRYRLPYSCSSTTDRHQDTYRCTS